MQCESCGTDEAVYELQTDRGPFHHCVQCLAIKRAQEHLRKPFEVFVDFDPGPFDETEEEVRARSERAYENARGWMTIAARAAQDEPIIERDPDDYGTVHDDIREFLQNVMGADAHKKPSEHTG